MRDLIRSITPNWLLNLYRKRKKQQTRKRIEEQKAMNKGWSKEDLKNQLKSLGIDCGDTVLVHSALSKMGYVVGGPQTVVDALLEVVGIEGHILMPNSPNASFQLDYIQHIECFDVANDVSKLGAITEVFRTHPRAERSCHPTEPVSCIGPDSAYFVGEHFGEETPYTEKSPFYRVAKRKGKILMIGVTLDNAGTNLHTLEDAVDDFKYPVYYPELFEVKVKFEDSSERTMKTKVHDPKWSKQRNCDDLIPIFEKEGILQKVKVGEAQTLLLDANEMLSTMIRLYKEHEVTMYDLGSYSTVTTK